MAERREREEEKREREERAWESTRQLQELKELQSQTQTKVYQCLRSCHFHVAVSSMQLEMAEEENATLHAEVEAVEKKERHWSLELTKLTAELQLSREKMGQLEREGAEVKSDLRRVQQELHDAQREVLVAMSLLHHWLLRQPDHVGLWYKLLYM